MKRILSSIASLSLLYVSAFGVHGCAGSARGS